MEIPVEFLARGCHLYLFDGCFLNPDSYREYNCQFYNQVHHFGDFVCSPAISDGATQAPAFVVAKAS